jgi:hypothetical protein
MHEATIEDAWNVEAETQSSLSFHIYSGSELPDKEEINDLSPKGYTALAWLWSPWFFLSAVLETAGTMPKIIPSFLQPAFSDFYGSAYELATQVGLNLYTIL